MLLVSLMLVGLQAVVGSEGWRERRYSEMPKLAPCEFGQPAQQTLLLEALPKEIQSELSRFFGPAGGLVDANGAFNRTDVIDDPKVPQRRFVRAYFVQNTWLIWYEHGGFGYHLHTLALTRWPGGRSDQANYRATPESSFTGDLCVGSKAFLAGARAASDM